MDAFQPIDQELNKLVENFRRYESHLADEIEDQAAHLQQIRSDPNALNTFINNNLNEYQKYLSRLLREPTWGLHAFYTAKHAFAVRYGQRALGLSAEQILRWPEYLRKLLEQVQHPDLQQFVKEDIALSPLLIATPSPHIPATPLDEQKPPLEEFIDDEEHDLGKQKIEPLRGGVAMVDRIGQQLGNYRLVEEIGGGGSAKVYRAKHCYLPNKEVAIKVLYAPALTKEGRKMFEQEAEIIQGLHHPHIIRLLDFGFERESGGTGDAFPYLVMPLARKGSLQGHYPRGDRLPMDTIVSYLNQVADALQYAHDDHDAEGKPKKITVHLDVKPANMLIGDDDEIWLSDFGIAVADHQTKKFTGQIAIQVQGANTIWGSPEYMAPERFNGWERRASDQYSLAIVAYEWLTGVPPFLYRGDQQEIMRQHQEVYPPSIYARFPQIPQQVEAVVMRALSKKPEERWPSVRVFAQEFASAASTIQRDEQQPDDQDSQGPTKPRRPPPPPPPPPPFSDIHSDATIPDHPAPSGSAGMQARTSGLDELRALFDFIPPQLRYLFRGSADFGRMHEFRSFRFWNYCLMVVCFFLLLIFESQFWYFELAGALLMWWVFQRFIRRVDPRVAQGVGLVVSVYYGFTFAVVAEQLRTIPHLAWLPSGLFLFVVVVAVSVFFNHRFAVKRLQ